MMIGFAGNSVGAAAIRNRSCRMCAIEERSVGEIVIEPATVSDGLQETAGGDARRPLLFMPSMGSDGNSAKRAFSGAPREVVQWDRATGYVGSWGELVDWVSAEYDAQQRTIVAESTGGTVALMMACRGVSGVDKVVLVNPVTSPRSELTTVAQMVPPALRNLVPDFDRFVAERSDLMGKITFSDEDLEKIEIPVILIVTEEDPVHPSYRESEKLLRHIPRAVRYTVKASGHFPLRQGALNLKSVVETADRLLQNVPKKVMEESDTNLIDAAKLARAKAFTAFMRSAFSPVFIGTNRIPNILPGERPILFVGNHTIFGVLDLFFFVEHFLDDQQVLARGLAHPFIFAEDFLLQQSGIKLEDFGATLVSPTNLYRLMSEKKWAFLFPGGFREALKKKGEKYTTIWPTAAEFVRTAAKFNAYIIPYGTVGPEDTFEILLDSDDYEKIPGVSERLREVSQSFPGGADPRSWRETEGEEFYSLAPPLVQFTGPSRHYVKFGSPIDTADLDYKDKAACQSVYEQVKDGVDRSIAELLQEREDDSYFDAPRRLRYEASNRTAAPSAWRWSVRGGAVPDEDL